MVENKGASTGCDKKENRQGVVIFFIMVVLVIISSAVYKSAMSNIKRSPFYDFMYITGAGETCKTRDDVIREYGEPVSSDRETIWGNAVRTTDTYERSFFGIGGYLRVEYDHYYNYSPDEIERVVWEIRREDFESIGRYRKAVKKTYDFLCSCKRYDTVGKTKGLDSKYWWDGWNDKYSNDCIDAEYGSAVTIFTYRIR